MERYWGTEGSQEEAPRNGLIRVCFDFCCAVEHLLFIPKVELPLLRPGIFRRMGITPPKGILLYGPPGCSKTLMAKALACESSRNFIAVKGPELFSKWVGESEKAISEVFRKARSAAPSIIFFDEIDSIASARSGNASGESADRVTDRVLSQLLVELDGVVPLSNVSILAATNRPDLLDPALLRPGRFDRAIFVEPPDLESATEILHLELRNMACAEDVNVAEIASACPGLSGAELGALCREAAILRISKDSNALKIFQEDLIEVAKKATPGITKDLLEKYRDFEMKSRANSEVASSGKETST